MTTQKWADMRCWIYLCLCVHSGIEKPIIGLNEEDTLMPCVQSRFLDKGTNATRWIWLQ